jgi:hypothetical protein
LPEGLAAPAERQVEPAIELADLRIKAPNRWDRLRRRVRIPPRWEQWLSDPRRRNRVGACTSIALHVAIILLLALVLEAPPPAPSTEPLRARVAPTTQDAVNAAVPQDDRLLLPTVRQITPQSLESLALAASPDLGLEPLDSGSAEPGTGERPAGMQLPNRLVDDSTSPRQRAGRPGGASGDAVPGLGAGAGGGPDLLQASDATMQGKLQRRTPGGRSEAVSYAGGTPQSEEAVERALRWFAAHQRTDGSWSFNHLSDACQHYCSRPGSEGSSTAATAMVLLPFLGAGYTHKQGDYQDVVRRGLVYLKNRGIRFSYGFDLRDGSMYGHALGTIAMCEAYGMTKDPELKDAAQAALDFISYAQDNNTGGWRYNLGEPGDTTVTGWMLMALKSGQMARLNVDSPAIFSARRFLASVQTADGSQYGYQSRKPRPATTAVGLLCRMYTGWQRDNPALAKGIAQLGTWGPSKDDIYYNYYATQTLFHWAGPEWEPWNRKMRDRLISTQEREGHPSGSWYFESQWSAAGGRLYNTAMATMILEVYYRFMPLYGEEAVKKTD